MENVFVTKEIKTEPIWDEMEVDSKDWPPRTASYLDGSQYREEQDFFMKEIKTIHPDQREEFERGDTLLSKVENPIKEIVNVSNIPISLNDLRTPNGLQWLNDNIINAYLQMICTRSAKDPKYPKVHFFNTFFFNNVASKGYSSVQRWTRKVDIFAHDIILIPIHIGLHWSMTVIDIPEKKMELYDSLYDGNVQVLTLLRNYMNSESLDKKKTPFDFSGWTIRPMNNIPRQQNESDCGVFSCQFGEFASRRAAPQFSQSDMPYYRQRMVYEIFSQKLMTSI